MISQWFTNLWWCTKVSSRWGNLYSLFATGRKQWIVSQSYRESDSMGSNGIRRNRRLGDTNKTSIWARNAWCASWSGVVACASNSTFIHIWRTHDGWQNSHVQLKGRRGYVGGRNCNKISGSRLQSRLNKTAGSAKGARRTVFLNTLNIVARSTRQGYFLRISRSTCENSNQISGSGCVGRPNIRGVWITVTNWCNWADSVVPEKKKGKELIMVALEHRSFEGCICKNTKHKYQTPLHWRNLFANEDQLFSFLFFPCLF